MSDKSINDTHSPGITELLMDSGVSILNLSTSRKVLSLLRSITIILSVIGGGVSTPSPLECSRKRPLKPLLFDFPLPEENDWLLLWKELPPIGAFPVGAFLIVVGTTKGLILIGSKTL